MFLRFIGAPILAVALTVASVGLTRPGCAQESADKPPAVDQQPAEPKPDPLTDEQRQQLLVELNEKTAQMDQLISEEKIGEVVKILKEIDLINEKIQDQRYFNYVLGRNRLAALYQIIGDYAQAEPLYLEMLAEVEKSAGKEHPAYATTLNGLAVLYHAMGDYERAKPLLLEVLAIGGKFSKEHSGYATALNDLGALYLDMGDYERAEPLFAESRAIRERIIGRENPYFANSLADEYRRRELLLDYADCLTNLAGIYRKKGDDARAEPLKTEADEIYKKRDREYQFADERTLISDLVITQKVFGKEHAEYVRSLYKLAEFYYSSGDFVRATVLFLEIRVVQEKTSGKEHPSYTFNLDRLADLYHLKLKDDAKASEFHREALAICEKVHGKEQLFYAYRLNKLAKLYRGMGDDAEAEALEAEARAIETRLSKK